MFVLNVDGVAQGTAHDPTDQYFSVALTCIKGRCLPD
jgi:hypothetical protein